MSWYCTLWNLFFYRSFIFFTCIFFAVGFSGVNVINYLLIISIFWLMYGYYKRNLRIIFALVFMYASLLSFGLSCVVFVRLSLLILQYKSVWDRNWIFIFVGGEVVGGGGCRIGVRLSFLIGVRIPFLIGVSLWKVCTGKQCFTELTQTFSW